MTDMTYDQYVDFEMNYHQSRENYITAMMMSLVLGDFETYSKALKKLSLMAPGEIEKDSYREVLSSIRLDKDFDLPLQYAGFCLDETVTVGEVDLNIGKLLKTEKTKCQLLYLFIEKLNSTLCFPDFKEEWLLTEQEAEHYEKLLQQSPNEYIQEALDVSTPKRLKERCKNEAVLLYVSGMTISKLRTLFDMAGNGDAYAMYCLSLCYKNGILVKKDSYTARRWRLQAAKHGCLIAIL